MLGTHHRRNRGGIRSLVWLRRDQTRRQKDRQRFSQMRMMCEHVSLAQRQPPAQLRRPKNSRHRPPDHAEMTLRRSPPTGRRLLWITLQLWSRPDENRPTSLTPYRTQVYLRSVSESGGNRRKRVAKSALRSSVYRKQLRVSMQAHSGSDGWIGRRMSRP